MIKYKVFGSIFCIAVVLNKTYGVTGTLSGGSNGVGGRPEVSTVTLADIS